MSKTVAVTTAEGVDHYTAAGWYLDREENLVLTADDKSAVATYSRTYWCSVAFVEAVK